MIESYIERNGRKLYGDEVTAYHRAHGTASYHCVKCGCEIPSPTIDTPPAHQNQCRNCGECPSIPLNTKGAAMTPTDLQLVSDEDLIKEILTRYDTAVFAGEREDHHDPKHIIFNRSWRGSFTVAMGLCFQVLQKISNENEHCVEEHSGEETDDA